MFLLFQQIGNHSGVLLSMELRNGRLWLVTQKQSFEISSKNTTTLHVGIGKIRLAEEHEATIIAAGEAILEYFVAIDGDIFKRAFEAEVAGILETAIEGDRNSMPFGSNLLLGGSNWSVEGEMRRDLEHLWSGLGRRKYFYGCIHR